MRTAIRSCLFVIVLCACKKGPGHLPVPSDRASAPPPTDLRPPADVQTTPSGLRTKVLRAGGGHEHPEPQDLVEVHFTGWKSDGAQFDSSYVRNAPNQFTVGETIKGWSDGVQLMVVGEKRRIWVPPQLAYGDKPPARVPAGALVFDLELLRIIKRPRPQPAPPDLATPPLRKTNTGLAYRVLTKGTGKQHPGPTSLVELQYTGWGPDGRMLDSTVATGRPARMQLNMAGPGWTEALRLMVAGEKTRFWIPPSMTAQMGISARSAVYDVELIGIQ
jgi:FKBP-type peptidyl-prolyl cis-trans isomerase